MPIDDVAADGLGGHSDARCLRPLREKQDHRDVVEGSLAEFGELLIAEPVGVALAPALHGRAELAVRDLLARYLAGPLVALGRVTARLRPEEDDEHDDDDAEDDENDFVPPLFAKCLKHVSSSPSMQAKARRIGKTKGRVLLAPARGSKAGSRTRGPEPCRGGEGRLVLTFLPRSPLHESS